MIEAIGKICLALVVISLIGALLVGLIGVLAAINDWGIPATLWANLAIGLCIVGAIALMALLIVMLFDY